MKKYNLRQIVKLCWWEYDFDKPQTFIFWIGDVEAGKYHVGRGFTSIHGFSNKFMDSTHTQCFMERLVKNKQHGKI